MTTSGLWSVAVIWVTVCWSDCTSIERVAAQPLFFWRFTIFFLHFQLMNEFTRKKSESKQENAYDVKYSHSKSIARLVTFRGVQIGT